VVHDESDDKTDSEKDGGGHEDADEALSEDRAGQQEEEGNAAEDASGEGFRAGREGKDPGQEGGETDEEKGALLQVMKDDEPIGEAAEGNGGDQKEESLAAGDSAAFIREIIVFLHVRSPFMRNQSRLELMLRYTEAKRARTILA
jgi:hypothetical protein